MLRSKRRVAAAALFMAAVGAVAPARTADKVAPEYSLWLVPSGREHARLKGMVDALAERQNTPRFEPHVTLIGLGKADGAKEEKVVAAAAALAEGLEAVPITLRKLGMQDSFFRSLYIEAEPTPRLMAAGAKGRSLHQELNGREPADPAYFPHLSILYGELPQARKDGIVDDDLGGQRQFDIRFIASSLELWDTGGKPERWRRLAGFALKPGEPEAPPPAPKPAPKPAKKTPPAKKQAAPAPGAR